MSSSHERMANRKSISICLCFLCFDFVPKPARKTNEALCKNAKIQKNCLLEKTPRGAHINKLYAAARGAPSAPGRGCCIKFRMFAKHFFAAKPQRSKITMVFSSFQASEAFWLPSGCVLGAWAGCALAAFWLRSGVRSPLPIARASLPAGHARIMIASLPAARPALRRSRSLAPSSPGQQPGRPQAELLR